MKHILRGMLVEKTRMNMISVAELVFIVKHYFFYSYTNDFCKIVDGIFVVLESYGFQKMEIFQ